MSGIVPLASIPKSGNTWLRIILDIVLRQGDGFALNNLKGADSCDYRGLFDEWLGVDSSDLTPDELSMVRAETVAQGWSVFAATRKSPVWFVKVHGAYLPEPGSKCLPLPASAIDRAVYIVRDPRDVALSMAHANTISVERAIEVLGDSTTAYLEHQDRIGTNLPQFVSDWSSHASSWLDHSDFPVHLMRYEDMLADPFQSFLGVFEFLGQQVSPADLTNAIQLARFDRLQQAEQDGAFAERAVAAPSFFRSGKEGDWRTQLNADQIRKVVTQHGPMMARLGYKG